MPWQVEYTDRFKEWWDTLSEEQQEDLVATVELLMEYGPTLPYLYSSGIAISRHTHMRELRTQSGGGRCAPSTLLTPGGHPSC